MGIHEVGCTNTQVCGSVGIYELSVVAMCVSVNVFKCVSIHRCVSM